MKNTCKMPLFLSFLWQFAINLVLLPTSSASAPVVSGEHYNTNAKFNNV